MNTLKILIAVLIFNNSSAMERLALIYKKDVSEHCRRRVVPSIFLGRQVIEANSRILQFSRLELPYSCYISVRTETGSSMVMMIQVTAPDLQDACRGGAQLLVYEMGETFGGYWGAWPEALLSGGSPSPRTYYTQKTTPITTTPTPSTTEEETERTEALRTSSKSRKESEGDYVQVEVPLANISVHFVPAEGTETPDSNLKDTFDLHNDVTPVEGVAYDRSILPLVQFRLAEQPGGRRVGVEPASYELDIFQDFTPDMRLTLPLLNQSSKRRNKHRYQATRRLHFKKHRTLLHSQRHHDRHVMPESITRKIEHVTKYRFPTIQYTNVTINRLKHSQDSWRVIEDLIKKLNKSEAKLSKTTMSVKEAILLERISENYHNKSAYLSPYLSVYDSHRNNDVEKHIPTAVSTSKPASLSISITEEYSSKEPVPMDQTEITSTIILEDTTKSQNEYHIKEISNSRGLTTQHIQYIETIEQVVTSTVDSSSISDTTQSNDVLTQTTEIQSNSPTEMTAKSSSLENTVDSENKINTIVTGSLVGHESWENLVQAAPEMAVLLNQSVSDVVSRNASGHFTQDINETSDKNKKLRRKRNIHSLAIEAARPHAASARPALRPTTLRPFRLPDMQELAQLVELQDDELHGRVALRHPSRYVGPPLYNLCQGSGDPATPRVHLFNSSRIVLSPNNFTLDRMVIILTAARALLSGELRCPRAKIECQVAGTRVCLDSTVACDGVPNCGSYDLYDEERLMCGHAASLQHGAGAQLAALTVLAVLLTAAYTVHYWLKRCVPRVAAAFFLYSDGVEDVLYVDTIMRSPHDTGEGPNTVSHTHSYDYVYDEDTAVPHKNACLRFLRALFCCHRKSPNKLEADISTSRKVYSFTELEIRKIINTSKDTAVQTGDSLEMRPLYTKDTKSIPSTSKRPLRTVGSSYDFTANITDSLLTLEEPLPEDHSDELSILQFLKATRTKRSNSIQSRSELAKYPPKITPKLDDKIQDSYDSPSEKEIGIHSYDRLPEPGPSRRGKDDKEHLASSGRHLRFNVVATEIQAVEKDGDIATNSGGRRKISSADRTRRHSRPLDTIEEADEQATVKEHRNFWGMTKKSKKKERVNLR